MPADAGTAWLDVLPRLVDFGSKLQSQVSSEMARAGSAGGRTFQAELSKIKAEVPITTDRARLDAELRDTGARVKAGAEAARSEIPLGLQAAQLDVQLAELPAKTQAATQQAAATVPIQAETSGFEGALQRIGNLAQQKFTAVAGQSTIASKALSLLQTVGVNVSQALTQTGESAQQSAEGMESSADAAATVGTAMYSTTPAAQNLSTAMKVGVAGAAVAVVAALKLAETGVRDFVSQTSEVRQIKAATGEAAEGASALRNQIVGLGIDTDTALKTLGIFSRNLVENASKFDQYGIAIERTKSGNIDVAATLQNVAAAYQATNGPAEKNAMLTDLLGRNSAALRPLLSANRQELERLAKTGPVYSEKDLATGKEFSRQSRELGLAVQRLGVSLGRGLVPVLATTFNGLAKLVDVTGRLIGPIVNVGRSIASFLLPGLGSLDRESKDAGDSAEELAASEEEAAVAMEEAADEARRLADRLDELAGAQRDALGAQMSVTDAHHQAWQNAMDLREAEEELAAAYAEHGRQGREAEEAEIRLEAARQNSQRGVEALARAVAEQELAQRRATGETITAVQENEAYRRRLIEFANTVEDPMRKELLLLATNIRELPDRDVRVTADTSAAEARIRALRVEIANLGPGGGRGAELAAAQNDVEANYGEPPAVVGGDPSLDFSGDEIPGAAEGAYVKARPGGTLVRVAEAGQDEIISPVPDGMAGIDYDRMEAAFRRAIAGLAIAVDDREFGRVVDRSLNNNRRVYA